MSLRQELIQVAAVAVAIVEDLDHGNTDHGRSAAVLEEVQEERVRQDEKWGAQHHDPLTWLMILAEEVGEVAEMIPWRSSDAAEAAGIRLQVIRAGRRARRWLTEQFGS